MMTETKNKKGLIYTIEEFEKTYLPKQRKGVEISVGNKMNEFGVNLVKRITSRVDIKV